MCCCSACCSWSIDGCCCGAEQSNELDLEMDRVSEASLFVDEVVIRRLSVSAELFFIFL